MSARGSHGFTRTDLLALLAALGVLTSLLLPALAGSGSGAASVGCLNNLRQLAQAWLVFAEDQSGRFASNVDDASPTGPNWAAGQAGTGGGQEFNPEVLTGPSRTQLAGYLGQRAEPFRCPADTRVGLYQGTNTLWKGKLVPAARSYAMNGAVGTKLDGYTPVNGAWLDGQYTHRRNSPWRTYGRLSDLVDPAPADLHVLLGEDPFSVNDGHFSMSMQTSEWIDWPETHHDFGGGFAFADGHAGMHRWEDSRTRVVNGNVSRLRVPGSPDVLWIQDRTSRQAE